MDAESVKIAMIKKYDRNNFIALDELNTSRVVAFRGGNHAYVWCDEGIKDPYFKSPNFYWSINKKTNMHYARQCSSVSERM